MPSASIRHARNVQTVRRTAHSSWVGIANRYATFRRRWNQRWGGSPSDRFKFRSSIHIQVAAIVQHGDFEEDAREGEEEDGWVARAASRVCPVRKDTENLRVPTEVCRRTQISGSVRYISRGRT